MIVHCRTLSLRFIRFTFHQFCRSLSIPLNSFTFLVGIKKCLIFLIGSDLTSTRGQKQLEEIQNVTVIIQKSKKRKIEVQIEKKVEREYGKSRSDLKKRAIPKTTM